MSVRFIPAALVAVFIALVAVGGAALAFSFGETDSKSTDDLLERAASDLGVEAQTLKNAFSQAQSELQTEQQQQALADLVEAEVITQAQSDEASAWLDQMPDSVNKLMRPEVLINIAMNANGPFAFGDSEHLKFRLPGLLLGDDPDGVVEKMADILGIDAETLEDALDGAQADQTADNRIEAVDDLIDKLVTDGEITAVEGDEIKAWLRAMPEWLNDPGLLLRIFSLGFSTQFSSPGFEGHRFLPRFGHGFGDRFEHDPSGIIPELDELRRGHGTEPFFFAPDGGGFDFDFPGSQFGDQDGLEQFRPDEFGPDDHFFFRGPEGEFNFEGEIPPEFEDLLKNLEERFGEGLRSGDLEDLFEDGFFESLPRFLPPVPALPDSSEDDSVTTTTTKGA